MINLLPLYKKTSTGAIQYWKISIDSDNNHGKIITEYGQLETGKPQTTIDIITEGKNIGKINETTSYEQALKEGKAKWQKQLKAGYVKSIEEAEEDKVDESVDGGVLPMLAHRYDEHGHKITFPCIGNPKLDGTRIISIVKDGKCKLYSRTRKRITSLPHIEKELEFLRIDIILDGEAYQHNNSFEDIVSLVRQEEAAENCTDIEYHIYDIVNNDPQYERYSKLKSILNNNNLKYIKLTDIVELHNEKELDDYFKQCLEKGYEGTIVRNYNGLYVNKRSYDLQKIKIMQDAEFPIIGITEGRGKLRGHAATFICLTPEGKKFEAKMKGELSKLKEYFNNPILWKDKLLTVQFQELSVDNIPRFPVGLRIREDI